MRSIAKGCYDCAADKLPPKDGPQIDEHHHIGSTPNRTPRARHIDVYVDGQPEHRAVQVYEGTKGEGWVLRAQPKEEGKGAKRCPCGSGDLEWEFVMGDVTVVDDGEV